MEWIFNLNTKKIPDACSMEIASNGLFRTCKYKTHISMATIGLESILFPIFGIIFWMKEIYIIHQSLVTIRGKHLSSSNTI